nr:DUF4468 domain-containing protein [Leptospira ognonensis]
MKVLLFTVFFFFFSNSMCLRLWIVSGKYRTIEESRENKSYQRTRSYLKAKQWLEYKLSPETSRIQNENPDSGLIEGIGLIRCYVPYGVGEVDANEHEFQYKITIRDGNATFLVEKIFSFIRDPNDIILNYGPKDEKVAKITLRSCFKPLMDDFFEYVK